MLALNLGVSVTVETLDLHIAYFYQSLVATQSASEM